MNENMNPIKHQMVINPHEIPKINIIGCGALGSKVAIEIAKIGAQDIHLYDFDTVSNHNIPNQWFTLNDVGKPKVESLSKLIEFLTGYAPVAHNEKVEKETVLSGITFILVDSMDARRQIYFNCIKEKHQIPFFIDARMGVSSYNIMTINPVSEKQCSWYEGEMLYSSEEVESTNDHVCTVVPSIGATSGMAANHVVWQFMKAFNYYFGSTKYMKECEIEKEVYVALTDTSAFYSKIW